MYIPYRSYHQRHTIKNYVWGELKRYVRYNTEEKNFKKLRVRFFLRLRNRGFKKYMLKKLFSKVTYAQRNELLKTDNPPLSNECNSVTLQEAEKRMLLEGEKRLAASQGETEDADIPVHRALHANNNNNNNTTNQNKANASRHSRVLSPEGWNLVFSPPQLCIIEKSLQNSC